MASISSGAGRQPIATRIVSQERLPEIVDPFKSVYGDIEVFPKWNVPEKVVISQTINGAFYSKRANPNQPVTPAFQREWIEHLIARWGRAVKESGATVD